MASLGGTAGVHFDGAPEALGSRHLWILAPPNQRRGFKVILPPVTRSLGPP